jgi:hypothetical protein
LSPCPRKDVSPPSDSVRLTIGPATEAAIRKALKKGDTGIRKIAATLGVGTGTVQRIKAEMSR